MDNKTLSKILARLAKDNGGNLQPQAVVDFAKPKDSPLHDRFTWDDTDAARLYRLEQARRIIRCAVVVMPTKHGDQTTRAYVNTDSLSRQHTPYKPISVVMRTPDLRAELLAQCKRDSETFAAKYAVLEEAAEVIETMRRKGLAAPAPYRGVSPLAPISQFQGASA